MSAIAKEATVPVATDPDLRSRVEDLLYEEADLLDSWRLDDWLELFTPDARYIVPPIDRPDADPNSSLTLVDDSYDRLTGRVHRLKSRRAHREFPWSTTRRVVGNVRATRIDDHIEATANYIVTRFRKEEVHQFVGRYRYELIEDGPDLRIRRKVSVIDNERLAPHGTLSILL